MKKILILGSAGMLGHVVYTHLNETGKYKIHNTSYPSVLNETSILLDITNKESVRKQILSISPQVLINCIGVLIKDSNSNPGNAIYINSYFPHQLESIAREINAKLIHISTDCVFSGDRGGYREDNITDARDIYGKSKALGEINNSYDLTLRTSIIGPELKSHGEGLFHWFINQKGKINGFTDHYWTGVTTLELAKAIDVSITKNIVGLHHIASSDKISKYALLTLFQEIFKINNLEINPYPTSKVDKSLIITKNKFYNVPDYKKMINEMKVWIIKYQDYYNNYGLQF